MENSDIKTDIFLKFNSSNNSDNLEQTQFSKFNDNISVDPKLLSGHIFENSHNVSSKFFNNDLSSTITFSDLTDTDILNDRLMDIHNYLLNSEYVPQNIINENNLNQSGGEYSTTSEFNFQSETSNDNVKSYADTSQIFPLTSAHTQSSVNLPINFSETESEIGRVVMDIKLVKNSKPKPKPKASKPKASKPKASKPKASKPKSKKVSKSKAKKASKPKGRKKSKPKAKKVSKPKGRKKSKK